MVLGLVELKQCSRKQMINVTIIVRIMIIIITIIIIIISIKIVIMIIKSIYLRMILKALGEKDVNRLLP